MLQGMQAQVGQRRGLRITPDGDYPALFMKLVRPAVQHLSPDILDFRFSISD
jgi:hypothetical protein